MYMNDYFKRCFSGQNNLAFRWLAGTIHGYTCICENILLNCTLDIRKNVSWSIVRLKVFFLLVMLKGLW